MTPSSSEITIFNDKMIYIKQYVNGKIEIHIDFLLHTIYFHFVSYKNFIYVHDTFNFI